MHTKRHPHLSNVFKIDRNFLLFFVWAMFPAYLSNGYTSTINLYILDERCFYLYRKHVINGHTPSCQV